MHPYRVDVSSILDVVGGYVDVSDGYPLAELVVGEERFELVEPAHFDVTISNAGEGLVATGRVSALVKAVCSRCLRDFETTIEGEIEGFYVRPGDHAPEEEEAGAVDRNEAIDIAPALVAALTVEAPFAPLHDEACKGLCPVCGADLNETSCNCADKPDESHPFAALRDLLGEQADGSGESDPE